MKVGPVSHVSSMIQGHLFYMLKLRMSVVSPIMSTEGRYHFAIRISIVVVDNYGQVWRTNTILLHRLSFHIC